MFATLAPWSIFFGIHTGWSRARKDARKHILAESEFLVKEAHRWVEPEAEGRLNGLEKEIWGQVKRRLFTQETKALEEHGAFQGMLIAQRSAPKAPSLRLWRETLIRNLGFFRGRASIG